MIAGRTAVLFLMFAVLGCGPGAAPSPTVGGSVGEGRPKVLTIGQPRAREGFGPWFIRGSGSVLQYEELHSNFLISTDVQGNYEGRLAASLPSLDDGTITVLPDGRMRTVWRMQTRAKWHDGAPFSAEDVVFGWQVASHPEIPAQQSPTFRMIDTIEAPDAGTAVITYKSTYFKAVELGFRDLYPLPRHLLADAFLGEKEAFTRLPYFSTEYVHAGPFRVREFVPGETVSLERFDDYYRGRPKLSAIFIRFIGDDNAMVSNLLAGAVDITAELPTHVAIQLARDWSQSGAGFVVSRQGNWRFISIQFHPEWGGPAELQRDVRVRRGLLLAIDRDAIREAVVPGFANTEADTFMTAADPRTSIVGAPFGRYKYDVEGAARELASTGWLRGPDGRLADAREQQVRIDIRTTGGFETELSAVADDWRRLGIDAVQEVATRALSQDREYVARFPGTEITSLGSSESVLRRFDSREQPLPENRYVGSNGGHYANRDLDRLLDQLYSTVDLRQQGALLRTAGELIATDLPALPLYYGVDTAIALRHVRALDDFGGSTGVGKTARNAHLWDRD